MGYIIASIIPGKKRPVDELSAGLTNDLKTEYLMRAILSLAAKHLSILRPQDPRYAEAAILLLSKSTRLFRESLSTPMTADTCDALVGTSVLINYMAWTDLGFLDGQRILECPEEGGLDMSGDLLFLLGSGVHQVFSSSFHVFHENHSVFIKVAQYHPCEKLEKEADRRGTAWRDTMERLVALFDDPRYVGSSPNTSVDDAPESPPEPCSLDCKSPPACTHIMQCRESLDNDQHDLEGNIQGAGDDTRNIPNFDPCPTARAIYERLARRISVILALIPPEGEIGNSTPPLPRSRLYDSQRYFYVFPTLCCGSFRPLITQGDSRALIILHHTYRAARRLSQIEETWWAGRRAVAMERLTLLELHARGLSAEI